MLTSLTKIRSIEEEKPHHVSFVNLVPCGILQMQDKNETKRLILTSPWWSHTTHQKMHSPFLRAMKNWG